MSTTNKVHIYGPDFSTFVRSVMLICEELGVAYTTGFSANGKAIEFKSDDHFKLHPYGKLPILLHDELVLPETTSICRYLQDNFSDTKTHWTSAQLAAEHDAFCAIIALYIDKAIVRDYLLEFVFPKGENKQVRMDVVQSNRSALQRALEIIEVEINRGKLLGTDKFTIADALVMPMLQYLTTLPAEVNCLEGFNAIKNYVERSMQRASCKKVLKSDNKPIA